MIRLINVIWKTTWDISRWVRLALGIFIIIIAVKESDKMFLMLGMIPLAQALFNVSCCGESCGVYNNKSVNSLQDTTFEEIKNN